jgi:adenylate cyclase class 2
MPIEIELKAHIQDSESLKTILTGRAESSYRFEKEDLYWSPKSGQPAPRIRIRREKRFFADGIFATGTFPPGNCESLCLVTYKKREMIDGIEINDEREFEIRSSSDDRAAEDFEGMLKLIGLEISASKKKRGWAFTIGEKEALQGLGKICAELVDVEGLGWFAELEILANNNREELLEEGKKRLLDFLDSLGIKKEAIESRYYTEMLASITPH